MHVSVPAFIAMYVIIFGLIVVCWTLLRALDHAARDRKDEMLEFASFILEVEVTPHVPTWDWWGRYEPWAPPASVVADSNDHLYPESAMIPSGGAQ